MRAAYRLIQQNGSRETSVHDVLRETGFSTRAFYRHFRSKDELVIEMYRVDSDRVDRRPGRGGRPRRRRRSTRSPRGSIRAWPSCTTPAGCGTRRCWRRPRSRARTGSPRCRSQGSRPNAHRSSSSSREGKAARRLPARPARRRRVRHPGRRARAHALTPVGAATRSRAPRHETTPSSSSGAPSAPEVRSARADASTGRTDLHVAVDRSALVGRQWEGRRTAQERPVGHVELAAVPRAGEHVAVEVSPRPSARRGGGTGRRGRRSRRRDGRR